MSAPMSRDDAQRIIERAIRMSKAEGVEVSVNANVTGNTRFAANQLTTSGVIEGSQFAVESFFGAKHAVVTTDDLSDASIQRAITQSEALAKLSPDDPEVMPSIPPQTYAPVNAYHEATAAAMPLDRARAALSALDPARKAGNVMASGFVVTGANASAFGNKAGLFAYHPSTTSNYTLTVRTSDGTGSSWAAADDHDWSRLDYKAVSTRAVDRAQRTRQPVAIEPGRYTVILEPQAVGDLVQLLVGYIAARSADEGRSPFVKAEGGNKIGEKIVDSRVTLISDPSDPQLGGQPFDGEGFPLARQTWIENGVLKQLFYSRFWAKKQEKSATGFPTTVKMLGGATSTDAMIASTPRGLLITRLWYLREVDPRTALYTGLTRDGVFLIEDGKIKSAVRNFRFNESPLYMLNNIEALGPAERLAGTEGGGDVVMPTVKARDFNFTSLSEAV
ncbi:MAG: TldD/PmbA family protein [Gemmatimonadaceae bacterium]